MGEGSQGECGEWGMRKERCRERERKGEVENVERGRVYGELLVTVLWCCYCEGH